MKEEEATSSAGPQQDAERSRVIPDATPTNVKQEEETANLVKLAQAGCALEIVGLTEDGTVEVRADHLQILVDNLQRLSKQFDDICIVSVVGPLRTGKSFLLDIFIRFLNTHPEVSTKEQQADISWLRDKSLKYEQGLFEWRTSHQRTTKGIWIYSKPFFRVIRDDHGKSQRVAVLLMDTQGLFDLESTKQTNNTVFGLSTLLSSIQILNVQNRIQENTLEELHLFTEFCHTALERFLGEDEAHTPEEIHTKFQALEFLVRDWVNFEDPEDLGSCEEMATKYLDEALGQRKHDDGGSRKRILESYDKTTCFLLPHPGTKMTKKGWDGEMEAVDEDFLNLINRYVHRLFDESLNSKRSLVPGITMSPQLLSHYIHSFVEAFSKDQALKAENVVTALSRSINMNARECAFNAYREDMDRKLQAGDFLSDDELAEFHSTCTQACLDEFSKLAAFGAKEERNLAREALEAQVEGEFSRFEQLNRSKMGRLLAKHAPMVLVALLAFVVDWVSDYVCDWWLETCRDLSGMLWLVYFGIFAFVAYNLYTLYSTKGPVVVSQSVFGLWSECVSLGDHVYKDVRKRFVPHQPSSHTAPPPATRSTSQRFKRE